MNQNCENCGANLNWQKETCDYCGTFFNQPNVKSVSPNPPKVKAVPKQSKVYGQSISPKEYRARQLGYRQMSADEIMLLRELTQENLIAQYHAGHTQQRRESSFWREVVGGALMGASSMFSRRD